MKERKEKQEKRQKKKQEKKKDEKKKKRAKGVETGPKIVFLHNNCQQKS